MKRSSRIGKALGLIFTTTALLVGCGGASAPSISVAIQSLSAPSVDQGQTISVTAQVLNDASNQGVTWSANCSATNCGQFSGQSGLTAVYTAPSPVRATLPVTILAKSVKDPSKQATSFITVLTPPSVTTTSLPGATGGVSYNAVLQEAGGLPPFGWSISSGSLPPGLGLAGDGTISGKPTVGGSSKFTVQVADSGSPPLTTSADLTINVIVLPLTVSTTSLPDGTVDEAYKQQILATGGIPPYVWSIQSGSLSSWASLNSSTGTINGIPDGTGTANFTVEVKDSEATALTSTSPLSLTTVAGTQTNNSELNGHYAFLFSGFDDATGTRLAIAGSFTADGKGKIVAGVEDGNGPGGVTLNAAFNGTYNIGADHRGAFTLYTPDGPRTFALVLSAITNGLAQNGRFAEFDDTTGTSGRRGSGILRAQDAGAFALGKITGPYAFGLAGQDATGNSEVVVGSFNADGAGSIPSGIADQNIAGAGTNPSLTGSYTTPSPTNGRAGLKLSLSGLANLDCSAYVVSATELLVVSTDPLASSGLVSGQIESQTSTSFDNSALDAPSIYYLLGVNIGVDPSRSTAEIGILQPDGQGNLTAEYDDQIGASIAKSQNFTSTYTVATSGRGVVNNWHDGQVRFFYLVAKNKAFFLDVDHAGLGFAEPQSAKPSGGYSNRSLSGTFSAATVFPSVTGSLNGTGPITLDGAGSFTEIMNASTLSGLSVDQTTSGTYSISAEGRGAVTSLSVTNAGINAYAVALAVVIAVLIGWKRPRQNTSRPAFAAFCCVALLATGPAGCPPPPKTDQLIFYIISPSKAVMIHEQSFAYTPDVVVIEQ
jgi:hypothetical protein